MQQDVICKLCERPYVYDTKRKQGHEKTICNSCSANKRRKNNKLKALAYFGSKCSKCGYNKCIRALCFHHIDPSTKNFEINLAALNYSWIKIQKELDKCVLLCANCHMEEHDRLCQQQ